jgi:hypothetical protein
LIGRNETPQSIREIRVNREDIAAAQTLRSPCGTSTVYDDGESWSPREIDQSRQSDPTAGNHDNVT